MAQVTHGGVLVIPQDIWQDQAEFTRDVRLRTEPHGWDDSHLGKIARTKELMLHLISECNEMLNACGTWKAHVPKTNVVNPAQIIQELIDIQKYWIMLCQLWGFGPDQLVHAYWAKSAAVRQRYAELWLAQLTRPTVIVDLDNVLADFTTGFARYMMAQWASVVPPDHVQHVMDTGQWFDAAAFHLTESQWADIKHAFRVSGGFATLPVMPGAHRLLDVLRANNIAVIGLTSRPIDRYPNIYVDTVVWLRQKDLALDHIWWGVDKAERLRYANEQTPGLMKHVVFAVDDDPKFVRQFAELNIPTFWLARHVPDTIQQMPSHVRWVANLMDIVLSEFPPMETP